MDELIRNFAIASFVICFICGLLVFAVNCGLFDSLIDSICFRHIKKIAGELKEEEENKKNGTL